MLLNAPCRTHPKFGFNLGIIILKHMGHKMLENGQGRTKR